MSPEIIIAAALFSIVVMGAALWLKKSISSGTDASLMEELREKREKSAQVPLLQESVRKLDTEKNALLEKIEELSNSLAARDIVIARKSEEEKNRIAEIGKSREKIAVLRENVETLTKRTERQKEMLAELEGENKQCRDSLAHLEKAHAAEKGLIEERLAELRENLEDASRQIHALEASKEVVRQESQEKSEEIARYEADLSAMEKNLEELRAQVKKAEEKIGTLNASLDNLIEENTRLKEERSSMAAQLAAQRENNEKLQKEFQAQSEQLELKLGEIMQKHLEAKMKRFDEASLKSIDSVLKPFRENLETFRKRVEESQEESTKKFAALSHEIERLAQAGMNIGKEAENLTNALKGKKQTQGSWGEMILESVLEYSGLVKGEHYDTQHSYRDDEGELKRPDVIVRLPQNRAIVIDSKVSLNDYDRYIRAETDEERTVAAKNVVRSFRGHIDNLVSKDYAHYCSGTLQYVFMFIPIEGAFALAVREDPNLYEYALKKHIVMVNPSTLIVTLRTIYLYWQSEQSSGLAAKMFEEAGKLYDKMAGFVDTFNRVGKQIDSAAASFNKAKSQLTDGRGNVLGRIEHLKRLGAKTTKTIAATKTEFQSYNPDEPEVEVVEKEALCASASNIAESKRK
ncbi:DNA recombination protein RmuC [Hydrogenimonas cancrithermarum]|uniref:DNA recombination protein RmuC n=1 Tax=Hydrogenimonas cancrithermarum TaxID=2993563 RepID=A0ABN6WS19_9BACT|nr:DNA recombination protein RmuC [Hydrogenimonas cancrithermarum]BDY11965.1 hypothetical protein HCR_02770 [Hydrogenimonas cancrithermarum]